MTESLGDVSVIFLDNGGVLHDNDKRTKEWERLVGEHLAPLLGGEPQAWGVANRAVFAEQWRRYETWSAEHALDEQYVDFFSTDEESSRWLVEMCEHVGVQAPKGSKGIALSAATQRFVRARVQSGFDDAAPGVRALHEAGYHLATASGETSEELARYLEALDVREMIAGRLYGPDLVQTQKASPLYYERILADTGVSPLKAVFIDDNHEAVSWAAETGAHAVHMCRDGDPAPAASRVVANLLEFVDLLENI